jgi:hypothetical protein
METLRLSWLEEDVMGGRWGAVVSVTFRLVKRLRTSLELTLIDRPKPCFRCDLSLDPSPVTGGVNSAPCPACAVSVRAPVGVGSLSRCLRTLKLFLGVSDGPKTASAGGG